MSILKLNSVIKLILTLDETLKVSKIVQICFMVLKSHHCMDYLGPMQNMMPIILVYDF